MDGNRLNIASGALVGIVDHVRWMTIRGLATFWAKQSIRNLSPGPKLALLPLVLGNCVHEGHVIGICC